jgi:hypothetical protein
MLQKKVPLTGLMTVEAIEKFLEPILDGWNCEQISLARFRKNYEQITSRIYATGSPVLLNVKGNKVLLCDPRSYLDLEEKRKSILSGIQTIEHALQIGLVDLPDERLRELERLKKDITGAKKTLRDLEWRKGETQKHLLAMQKRKELLIKSLKNANGSAGRTA